MVYFFLSLLTTREKKKRILFNKTTYWVISKLIFGDKKALQQIKNCYRRYNKIQHCCLATSIVNTFKHATRIGNPLGLLFWSHHHPLLR